MKLVKNYSEDDQEIYFHTSMQLGTDSQKRISFIAATISGSVDKPNEDAFAAALQGEVLVSGIFDGTTSFPIPALGKTSSARYASHFIKDQFGIITKSMSPKQIMLTINDYLWQKVQNLKGVTLSNTLTLPASTATIIKINADKNVLTFAHIGDTFGIAYGKDGHSEVFTDNKNKPFDEEMLSLIHNIAKEKGITNHEARLDKRVDQALGEMYYRRNNNPDGQGCGLINGDPHMKLYIQTGEINLQGIKTILLGTDGLMPQGWSEHNEKDRQRLFDEIRTNGFQKLFKIKKQSEDADPDWQHIRYKHSDDATGILIQMEYDS